MTLHSSYIHTLIEEKPIITLEVRFLNNSSKRSNFFCKAQIESNKTLINNMTNFYK